MTVPTYTVYTGETPDFKTRPRGIFRHTFRPTLLTRIADVNGWKSLWDNTIIPRANTLKTQSASTLAGGSGPTALGKLGVLSLAGYLTESGRPAGGYKAAAIAGADHLRTLALGGGNDNRRYRAAALAAVSDILWDDLTSTEKNNFASHAISRIDDNGFQSSEEFDGFSGNNQAEALWLELVFHGHASVASQIQTRLDNTMGFLYGVTANRGRFETDRYQHADGGSEKGHWYDSYGFEGSVRSLWFLKNGTNIDTWTQEASWAQKIWEWYLWSTHGGAYGWDYESLNDTARVQEPLLHNYHRWPMVILADRYPSPGGNQGGQMLRWLYDQWNALDSPFADNLVWDIIFLDRAGVAPIEPKNATTKPARSRLMKPPGIYYYRQTKRGSGKDPWEYADAATIRIKSRLRYWEGHSHLDAGSVRMSVKGDPVLLAPAGYYDDFGGSHHLNAYQRTWLQSLAPMVKDPSQTFQNYGTTVVNDGGQHYKKYDAAVAPAGVSDPNYVYAMLNDAGGEAWRNCERFDKVTEDLAKGVFLVADIRNAYRKRHTDAQRCSILTCKYLIIEPSVANGLNWPALLYYARIKKNDPNWVTQIPLHSTIAFTSTGYGFHTKGFYNVGKLWVDIRNVSDYTLINNAPGTPLDAFGFGPNQFKISGSGTNYPPSEAPNSRHLPELKKHSMYVEQTVKVQEERYVMLLMLSEAADAEPVTGRTWHTDAAYPDYYGLHIGSEDYLLHRTADLAIIGGAADITPPAEVTGKTLTPKNASIRAQWTDPVDSDYDKAKVFYRTS